MATKDVHCAVKVGWAPLRLFLFEVQHSKQMICHASDETTFDSLVVRMGSLVLVTRMVDARVCVQQTAPACAARSGTAVFPVAADPDRPLLLQLAVGLRLWLGVGPGLR